MKKFLIIIVLLIIIIGATVYFFNSNREQKEYTDRDFVVLGRDELPTINYILGTNLKVIKMESGKENDGVYETYYFENNSIEDDEIDLFSYSEALHEGYGYGDSNAEFEGDRLFEKQSKEPNQMVSILLHIEDDCIKYIKYSKYSQ